MKRNLILTLVIAVFAFGCNKGDEKNVNEMVKDVFEEMQQGNINNKVNDGVFIHLSHGPEEPQRVLMALKMADIMSETKDVILYLDIKAVFVVLKDAEDIKFKQFPSSLELINKLKENKVPIMVCPGCLQAADKTPEDVMEGILIADKDKFFNFTEGRILTIDY